MNNHMNKVLVLCIIFSLTLFTLPTISYACSCEVPSTVEEEVQRKTAVFSGKVIEITEQDKGEIQSTADPVEVLFEVTNTWKGVDETQVLIYTASSSASCGFNFNVGDEYLVYASGDKSRLITGLCDRTTLLSGATEDIAALGEGESPTKEVDLEEGMNQEEDMDQGEYVEGGEKQKQEELKQVEHNGSVAQWILVGGLLITIFIIFYLFRYWVKINKNKHN